MKLRVRFKDFRVSCVLIILIAGSVLNLSIIQVAKPDYSVDEFVVTEISRQPLAQILDTISVEPHPPGFYFFLKLFPTNDPELAKETAIVFSFIANLVVIWYAHKSHALEKYKLVFGLSIYFSSVTFLYMSGDLKQEIVTAPLLLLTLISAMNFIKKKKLTDFYILHLSTIVLLFFGYINYIYAFIILATITLMIKRRVAFKLLFMHLVIVFLYLSTFGFNQVLINLHRFGWKQEYFNSLFQTFSLHTTGAYLQNFYTDIPIFILMTLLVITAIKYKVFVKKFKEKNILILFGILFTTTILLSYLSTSFVRPRYVIGLFLLLQIIAGWSLEIFIPSKRLALGIIFLFFAFGISGYGISQIKTKSLSSQANAYISSVVSGQSAMVGKRGAGVLAYKLLHFKKNENLIPVNILDPHVLETKNTIDKQSLLLDTEHQDLTLEKATNNLVSLNIHNFIYPLLLPEKGSFFDKNEIAIQTLDLNCLNRTTKIISNSSIIFVYKNCFIQGTQ